MNGIEQVKKLCARLSFSHTMRNKLAVEIAVMIFEEVLSAGILPQNCGLDGITSSKLQKYLGYYDFACALDEEKADRLNMWTKAPSYLREVFGDKELSNDEKNCYAVLLAALEDRYEKYDGSGYPKGKRHDEICPLAHITAIADLVADKRLSCVSEKSMSDSIDEAAATYFSPRLAAVARIVVKKLFDADREWFSLLGEQSSVQLDQLSVVDSFKNTPIGYESRMILRDKSGDGMIPEVYVPVAEKTGRAGNITLLHIEKICHTLFEGRLNGIDNVCPIWISIPAVCLTAKIFSLTLKRILKKYAVYPDRFVFQITETALGLEDPTLTESVAELKDIGISFAVEHFGNEYSSLAVLADFDADTVKLDRVFSQSVTDNKKMFEIVKSVVGLAENLGVRVVATGVDTPAAKDILMEAGIRFMQGDAFAGFDEK